MIDKIANKLFDFLPTKLYSAHRPPLRAIQFEITTKCNLSCKMCPRPEFGGFTPNKDMPFEMYEKVIKQLPHLDTVYLWGVGEPFMNPNCMKMIRFAKSVGLKVIINTNGTLLNATISDELIKLGVDEIIFSIDGIGSTFEEIRKGARFDDVIHNIRELKAFKMNSNIKLPKLSANFVLLKDNFEEAPKVAQLAYRIGIEEIKFQNVIDWNEYTYKQSMLSFEYDEKEEKIYMNNKLYDLYMNKLCEEDNIDFNFSRIKHIAELNKIKIRLPNFKINDKPKCKFPFFGPPNIRWDGSVTPCCFIAYPIPIHHILKDGKIAFGKRMFNPLIMGNINENTINTIWNNEKYKKLRNSYKIGKPIHPCDICLSQFGVIC